VCGRPHSLQSTDWGAIRRWSFSQVVVPLGRGGTIEAQLSVVIRLSSTRDEVVLRFRGVRDFRFDQPSGGLADLGRLELRSTTGDEYEAIEATGRLSFRFSSCDGSEDGFASGPLA
jgi:hypothetical protein